MNFIDAWKKMLNGEKIRRRDWDLGTYLCIKNGELCYFKTGYEKELSTLVAFYKKGYDELFDTKADWELFIEPKITLCVECHEFKYHLNKISFYKMHQIPHTIDVGKSIYVTECDKCGVYGRQVPKIILDIVHGLIYDVLVLIDIDEYYKINGKTFKKEDDE